MPAATVSETLPPVVDAPLLARRRVPTLLGGAWQGRCSIMRQKACARFLGAVCAQAVNDRSRQTGRISGTAGRPAESSPSASPKRPAGGICSSDWTRATLDGLSSVRHRATV